MNRPLPFWSVPSGALVCGVVTLCAPVPLVAQAAGGGSAAERAEPASESPAVPAEPEGDGWFVAGCFTTPD